MTTKLLLATIVYLLSFVLWAIWIVMSSVAWPVWMSPIYAASLIAYPFSVFYILITAFKRQRAGLAVDVRYYLWPLEPV